MGPESCFLPCRIDDAVPPPCPPPFPPPPRSLFPFLLRQCLPRGPALVREDEGFAVKNGMKSGRAFYARWAPLSPPAEILLKSKFFPRPGPHEGVVGGNSARRPRHLVTNSAPPTPLPRPPPPPPVLTRQPSPQTKPIRPKKKAPDFPGPRGSPLFLFFPSPACPRHGYPGIWRPRPGCRGRPLFSAHPTSPQLPEPHRRGLFPPGDPPSLVFFGWPLSFHGFLEEQKERGPHVCTNRGWPVARWAKCLTIGGPLPL